MNIRFWLSLLVACNIESIGWADEPVKVTFDDHIKPILREHCTSCHHANDKKSGLALDSYQAVRTGGSSGEVVYEGDLDASRLYALVAHQEQPYMPPNQDMIPQAKVDLIKTWIEQGMPENSGSEIKKPKASSMALSVTIGRPEGAPPMPGRLLKQTPFATTRAATTSAIAASPWSPLVAVGGQMQVSLYHSESGELLGILPFPEGEPQSISFSRDGKLILVGGGKHSHSGYAALYEIATGNRIARVGDELDIVLSADINDNNQLIAIAGPQKLVRVYETLTGTLKYEQKKHTDWIYSVKFSPDGLLLASSDRSAGLVVWEAETGRLYLDLQGHKGEIRSLAWRPDSAALISASMDGTLKLWEMNEGKTIKSWDAHGGGAMAVDVCNDGTMVSTGVDRKVKVWDINGNAAGEMPPLVEAGHEVAITVDAKQVAAGDWAGNVRLWQRANPQIESSIPANPLPLEEMLAHAQTTLQQHAAKMQELESISTAQSALQATLQKEFDTLQNQLTVAESELKTATEMEASIKPTYDALQVEFNARSTELQSIRETAAAKQNLIAVANNNKQSFESQLQELANQPPATTPEGTAPTPPADSKKSDLEGQIGVQVAAITLLSNELNPLLEDIKVREPVWMELKTKFDAASLQWKEVTAKVQTYTAQKNELAPQIEPKKVALQATIEGAQKAKTEWDASIVANKNSEALVARLQEDLVLFNNRQHELEQAKNGFDIALLEANKQVTGIETSIASSKSQSDAIATEIAGLEAKLADLQKRLSEEAAKKDLAANELNEKKQSLGAVQEQISQLETDIANSALQMELFQKAYGEKAP